MRFKEYQVVNVHNGKKYGKFWMDENGNCDELSHKDLNMILNAMVLGELCVEPTGEITDDEYDDEYESYRKIAS